MKKQLIKLLMQHFPDNKVNEAANDIMTLFTTVPDSYEHTILRMVTHLDAPSTIERMSNNNWELLAVTGDNLYTLFFRRKLATYDVSG